MTARLPLCADCRHSHDERRPTGSGPAMVTCARYRSLADGLTRVPCDAVRNFRCGLAGIGCESKLDGSLEMRAPLPTKAIKSQVDAMVSHGLHDDARLLVRGMFRDGLGRLERDDRKVASLAQSFGRRNVAHIP